MFPAPLRNPEQGPSLRAHHWKDRDRLPQAVGIIRVLFRILRGILMHDLSGRRDQGEELTIGIELEIGVQGARRIAAILPGSKNNQELAARNNGRRESPAPQVCS